jgi:hypothetical protein
VTVDELESALRQQERTLRPFGPVAVLNAAVTEVLRQSMRRMTLLRGDPFRERFSVTRLVRDLYPPPALGTLVMQQSMLETHRQAMRTLNYDAMASMRTMQSVIADGALANALRTLKALQASGVACNARSPRRR